MIASATIASPFIIPSARYWLEIACKIGTPSPLTPIIEAITTIANAIIMVWFTPANIVGRDRVIAGTDCGFSTFAGFGSVDADITYAKLSSLAKGAELASKKLW